jgi:hypothetical protein
LVQLVPFVTLNVDVVESVYVIVYVSVTHTVFVFRILTIHLPSSQSTPSVPLVPSVPFCQFVTLKVDVLESVYVIVYVSTNQTVHVLTIDDIHTQSVPTNAVFAHTNVTVLASSNTKTISFHTKDTDSTQAPSNHFRLSVFIL